jgi:hypothetical protein
MSGLTLHIKGTEHITYNYHYVNNSVHCSVYCCVANVHGCRVMYVVDSGSNDSCTCVKGDAMPLFLPHGMATVGWIVQ